MAAIRRKVVIVGDTGCGKTSLITAFSQGALPSVTLPTLSELQLVDHQTSNGQMKLSLWDTADQDELRPLRRLSYFDSDIVLICFSIDSRKSLDNALRVWAPEVHRFCGANPTILVGCKKDLRNNTKMKDIKEFAQESEEHVTPRQAMKVSRKIKAKKYLECSASTLEGVQDVFDAAAQTVLYLRAGHGHLLSKS